MGRHEKSQIKLYHSFFGELKQIKLKILEWVGMKILCTIAPFLAALIPALNPIAFFFFSVQEGKKLGARGQ